MQLPLIGKEAAEQAWHAYHSGQNFDSSSITIDFIGQYEEKLSDSELSNLVSHLQDIQSQYPEKRARAPDMGGKIDSEITEIIHSELSKHAHVHELSQIGFWRWLSNIACEGFFWKFIMWRFESEQLINWGITDRLGPEIEVYLCRAWLRAHKMWDPKESDPYKYAKLGSSDVWRSHILRQDFGKDKEFVKAFLDTIYNSNGKTVVKTKELRTKLIPALRAWTSGATFSHLSYKENKELIMKLLTASEI